MQFFVQPHAHFQIIMIVPFFLCKVKTFIVRLVFSKYVRRQQTTLQLVILNISIEIIKNRFPLNSNRSKFNFTNAPTARWSSHQVLFSHHSSICLEPIFYFAHLTWQISKLTTSTAKTSIFKVKKPNSFRTTIVQIVNNAYNAFIIIIYRRIHRGQGFGHTRN